jgi:mono/diheme cytochrome c family protein
MIVLAIGGIFTYLFAALPKKEEPAQITVEATPGSLARGEYLSRHVTVCVHCHAERNMQFFASPPISATAGKGGFFFREAGLGELYSPNITPHSLEKWTDGEIIRAVTAGVNQEGDPLFPIMPYKLYAQLKQEDLHAIVAYVRTLKPIHAEIPRSKLEFPLNLIVRMIPGPTPVDPTIQSNEGYYLATIAGCIQCHTPVDDRGQGLPGMTLAGGQRFGTVKSANITPDPETGIGKWTKEEFVATFKKWQDPALQSIVVAPEQNTVMPWVDFSGMKEEDLAAIYDYLRTVPAIRNPIEKFERP